MTATASRIGSLAAPSASLEINRRELLKMAGIGAGALLLPGSLPSGILEAKATSTSAAPVQQTRKVDQQYAIGYILSTEQWPVDQLLEQALAAEAAGFDAVWSSDHFHPWQNNEGHAGQAWILLSAIGQRTKNIFFGTGVTCPTFRYRPAIVAEAFASLSRLYPGRVFLGTGTGEALNEQPSGGGWGKYPERAGRLAEAVQIIKKLWSGDWVDFKGQYYQISHARLYDPPQQAIPLYMAAAGPKSMKLSGQYGDGLVTDPTRAMNPELRAAWESGAKGAGKDPASLAILSEFFVFVGDENDPELKQNAELWRFLPKAWSVFVNNPDPVAINQGADQQVPLDEVTNNFVVGADPEIHAQRILGAFKAGISQAFIHSAQKDQQKVIDFYGKQVLPLVRSRLTAENLQSA